MSTPARLTGKAVLVLAFSMIGYSNAFAEQLKAQDKDAVSKALDQFIANGCAQDSTKPKCIQLKDQTRILMGMPKIRPRPREVETLEFKNGKFKYRYQSGGFVE